MTDARESGTRANQAEVPENFLDEAIWAIQASQTDHDVTPGPRQIISALNALTYAVLSVAEEVNHGR